MNSDINKNDVEATGHNPIDLASILAFVKRNIKAMVIAGVVSMAISAVFVFSIPREYEATVVLAPEFSGSSSLSGSLGSIASMVGVNLGSGSGEDAIYPDVYPDILSSTQFLTSLYDVKVKSLNENFSCSVYDYYLKHQKGTWWGKGIHSIRNLFKKKPILPPISSDGKPNPKWLSFEQDMVCKGIDNSIVCGVDKKTSVITLTYWSQDPLVSLMMADSVVAKLQDFIIEYRTKKVRGDLEYMEKLLVDARISLNKAQSNYSSYCDSHRAILVQRDLSERDRLETELTICKENYTQISQQLQLLKGKVQEKTPSFTVIKNATMPEKPSKPKRMITMIVFFVLGMFGCGFYKYVKNTGSRKGSRDE